LKPARKLTLNLAWLYGGEAVAKLLPMLLFAWLARVLGDERYGDLEFAISIWFILNLAQEAGLGPYGSREAAKAPERTGKLVGVVVMLRVALVATALLALWLLTLAIDLAPDAERVVLCYGLVLMPAPLVLNWVFQARDEMPVVASSSILRQFVLVGGAFLLVREAADAWMVPASEAVGLTCVALLHQTLFRRRVGRIEFAGIFRRVARVVREALPLAASSFVWAIRIYFPVVALRLLAGSSETAMFASGHRLVIAAHTFVWLYFFNLLPSLSRASLDPERKDYRRLVGTSLRVVGWTVLPGCLLLGLLSPIVIPVVYGKDFAAGADPFSVSVWMLAAAFLSGHMRYALIAFNRQVEEFRAALLGAAVSVGGCLLLGASLTPMKAALIFLGAEVTTLLAAEVFLARTVEPLRTVRRVARPVLVVGAAAAVAYLVVPGGALVRAATGLGICAAGALVLERHLVGDVRRFLREIRGGAQ
jgi:O-antigen/teichoic acid export membrane protein